MEARLVALDDIAHAIICEVAFLRLTKDASGNQTSQGYFYLRCQMELGTVIFGGRHTNLFLFNSCLFNKFCKADSVLRVSNDSC